LANSFTDSSTGGAGSPHTITAVGNVVNTRAQSKVGDSSIYFAATGDYLTIPVSADWNLGSSWTVEFWVRPVTTGTAHEKILSTRNGNGWEFGTDNADHFMYEGFGTSATSGTKNSTSTYSADTWYHIAFTFDGSNTKLYFDGTLENTYANTFPWDAANALWICQADTYGEHFPGYLDEIRISDTVRYSDDFTPQTTEFTDDSNTRLLIHSNWDGGFGLDSSGEGNNFTPTNLVATDQMIDTPTNNSTRQSGR
jgi:hypothetical protein